MQNIFKNKENINVFNELRIDQNSLEQQRNRSRVFELTGFWTKKHRKQV